MRDQRYRVIERLESGGMAEVFLGEATSVQGFKKRVAIKRVLPHLGSQTNFIGMFLDEARLGARLDHANIVNVFDIGASDDTYFIVMEFVDGSNLKRMIQAYRDKNEHFPLKAAIFIAIEVCRGLSHAHALRDEEGRPMELVHRDVSPPNILVSRAGEVKVTDFGLAKARTQIEKTDPGIVKGKFSYLSPEAVLGAEVDGRSDVFALGACIWEMLGGSKLFQGKTDYETVQQVSQTTIPSLIGIHPEVDQSFETILRKALTRDPKDRFQTAQEFGDALADHLFDHKLKITAYDLAHIVEKTLKSEEPTARSPGKINTLIQEELTRFRPIEEASAVDPASLALDPDDVAGGSLENPSSWFKSDRDVAEAVDRVASIRAPSASMDFDDDLEDSVTKIVIPENDILEYVDEASELEDLQARRRPIPSTRRPPPPKSNNALSVLLALLLVLAGIGGITLVYSLLS